jgi:hypothetical protein
MRVIKGAYGKHKIDGNLLAQSETFQSNNQLEMWPLDALEIIANDGYSCGLLIS